MRTITPVMLRPSRSLNVAVSPRWNSRACVFLLAGSGWRLIGSLLLATICTVIALHRQARDLPGSVGAFFQDRRLRVPHGDDLAAAHLTVAEVDELHRLA